VRQGLQLIVTLLGLAVTSTLAQAQTSPPLRIGVLGDQSGVVADIGGRGSVLAAHMAAQDAGGSVLGRKIEILDADHQEKTDIAVGIARRWFDVEGVSAIADVPNTGVVLALQQIARDKGRTLMVSGAASADITGKSCSPYTSHWTDDTYALANGTARVIVQEPNRRSWFFLTADYSFGYDLERDATRTIEALGGHVAGSARFPLGSADFSSLLLQAQASGAQVIGLASAGSDTINAIKQAHEFGLTNGGQVLAALHAFITDVAAIGLPNAQGLVITTGFYWDQDAGTRAWSQRFMAEQGRMPTREQAGVYVSVRHYLKAVAAAGTDEAGPVNAAMRRLPVDRFGTPAVLRADGRLLYDIGVYVVKAPEESKQPWDYYHRIATVPAEQAFRPLAAGGCAVAAVTQ
jgi:branched-chain amino acid transport system substrate-binding protein